MAPSPKEQRPFLRSLDELDQEEVRAIRENLAWFRRFGPVERLRIAARQARLMGRLQAACREARRGS
jgi:hypothetical protein